MTLNLAVRIRQAPQGVPRPQDFELVEQPLQPVGSGEVLFRAQLMSLDPAMRRYLPAGADSPGPLGGTASIGDIAVAGPRPPANGYSGAFVGEVLESRHPEFKTGDLVHGGSRWQLYHIVPGDSLARVPDGANLYDELGPLGQPGFVAWLGLRRIGKPKPGETVVVSAAGGAIGMTAGQIAKADGARVIGIASGEKARFVVEELGFDACIDRSIEGVAAGLDRLCPDGIDVYFDNVGGEIGRAAFDRLRDFGRFVVCGMASEYNARESDVGPPLRPVLRKRLRIEGFVVYDHYDEFTTFRSHMEGLRARGQLHYRFDIVDGLENAVTGLARLLRGENTGKMVVRLTG